MDKNELSRIADLAGNDHAPSASVLVPDVRSGSTFSYSGEGEEDDPNPLFLVVWFYTVAPKKRKLFFEMVRAFESNSDNLPQLGSGVVYNGTYSVSVSSAAPKFEYRTVWGLTELSKLQALNDYIHGAADDSPLKQVLTLISTKRAMRTEIMGLTGNSATLSGD